MAIYSLSQRSSNTTINGVTWSVITASTDRATILELGITINAATASVFGLGRPAANGTTPTSPVTVLAEDPGDPTGTVTACLAWTTGPTSPTQFFRRCSTPATIGSGIIWTFPRGLIIPVSSNMVIWNITAVSASDVWVVVDE